MKILKILLLFGFCFLITANSFSQWVEDEEDEKKEIGYNDEEIFQFPDTKPKFSKGYETLKKIIKKRIRYPEEEKMKKIEGTQHLLVEITKTGGIGKIKPQYTTHPNFEKELIRVVKKLPKFIPGIKDGKQVNAWYWISYKFELPPPNIKHYKDFWFITKENDGTKSKDFFVKTFSKNRFYVHFPKKDDVIKYSLGYSIGKNKKTQQLLMLVAKELNDFDSMLKEIKSKKHTIYSANQECLLVVNRFATKDNFYKLKDISIDKDLINKDCYKGLLPIPNFSSLKYYDENSECHLSEDFKIYIIKASPGIYLDQKNLSDGEYMPNEWKNGFSRGYAISEEKKVIIYWVILW